MAIPAISDVLSQMQSINTINPVAIRESAGHANSVLPSDFASFLNSAITKISDTQNLANADAEAFERGEPDIELSEVMVNLQKATIGLQLGVQIRNRVIQAYQEIMNMPV